MARIGQPVQRGSSGRRLGVGLVLAAVIGGGGVVLKETLDEPEPTPRTVQAPASVAAGPLLRDGFEGAGDGGGVPPDACSGPLVKPAGMAPLVVTWEKMWSSKRPGSVQMPFPRSPGFPVGIGSAPTQYQTARFMAPPSTTGNLFFDPHQARPHEGEPKGRPVSAMFLSISECMGDFRTPQNRCWVYANTAALVWSTRPVPAGSAACPLVAGRWYYLLVSPVNPTDGAVSGDNTCRFPDDPPCWVQAKHTTM